MPDASHASWMERALAAMSEGMCPNHLTPLRDSGWCVACRRWYRADFPARTVTAYHPIPVTRPAELLPGLSRLALPQSFDHPVHHVI